MTSCVGQVVRAVPSHVSVPVAGRSPCHLRAVQSGGVREDVRCGGYQLGLVTSITAYDWSAAEFTYRRRGPLQRAFHDHTDGWNRSHVWKARPIRKSNWLPGGADLSCINVFCSSSIQYSMLNTLWLSMLSIKMILHPNTTSNNSTSKFTLFGEVFKQACKACIPELLTKRPKHRLLCGLAHWQ